jgi:hypothetical protein
LAIAYLENNQEHMRYDEYIAEGYPIDSGVAEGACRHLVKDRMEQSGMRWTVSGAQAMLHVRVMYLNDQWNEFIEDRIVREQSRLYRKSVALRTATYGQTKISLGSHYAGSWRNGRMYHIPNDREEPVAINSGT